MAGEWYDQQPSQTLINPRTGSDQGKPVWLSGATGFIGRNLQHSLLDAGVPVRAFVRPQSKHFDQITSATQVVRGEMDDLSTLRQSLSGVRAVIYAAGTVRGRRLKDFESANVRGIAALAEALSGMEQPPPLLLISSLAASEPGLSDYAASKAHGEQILRASALKSWTILRPPAVYGPGDVEMRPIFTLMRQGLVLRPGTASQRIALIHVSDLCAAVLAWLDDPEPCTQSSFALDDGYQGADGPAYSWPEMVQAVSPARKKNKVVCLGVPRWLLRTLGHANAWFSDLFGYAPMLTPGKARELQHEQWLCDNSAFCGLTHWQPKVNLATGVAGLFEPGDS